MVDDIKAKGTSPLDIFRTQEQAEETKESKRNDVVQREDFLQILVTQLQNQDPLNPMSNDQFAVDLAQFSQLEQLINLNEKFDQQGTDAGSLAQYLGHRVAIDSADIDLSALELEQIEVKLPSDAQVAINLLDGNGEVVSSLPIGFLNKGTHAIDLSEFTDLTGKYQFEVSATDTSGSEIPAQSYLLGSVTGFVPGPNGSLLVGDREVGMDGVRLVRE